MSEPLIEIRGLRKVYRVGKVDVQALRGVDLDVPPGEFLAIVGPSGSGKSTLFHIIGGLRRLAAAVCASAVRISLRLPTPAARRCERTKSDSFFRNLTYCLT